jgi:uncharacterized protein YdaU (DUF1376 family)
MSHHPWMPFYIQDFELDTLDLDEGEIGVYLRMICLAWKRGDGSLPSDLKQLKHLLQALIRDFHGHKFNRIVPKLLARYWYKQGEQYFQKRVVFELKKADKVAANLSQISNKRWSKYRQTNINFNKNNDVDDAAAYPQAYAPAITSHHITYKKDAADAAQVEKNFFSEGKLLLGENGIGLLVNLRKAYSDDYGKALHALRTAADKQDPREYLARIVNGHPIAEASSVTEKLTQSIDGRFYAKAESPQLAAWESFTGKQVRDRDGGWWFSAEWPPQQSRTA